MKKRMPIKNITRSSGISITFLVSKIDVFATMSNVHIMMIMNRNLVFFFIFLPLALL